MTYRKLAMAVGKALSGGDERLASSVLGASSVDQDHEDPSNVLKWSQCAPVCITPIKTCTHLLLGNESKRTRGRQN